jgi:hypothetical protein
MKQKQQTTEEMIDWAYKQILVAQDTRVSMRDVAAIIVLAAAKWGGDNVRDYERKQQK